MDICTTGSRGSVARQRQHPLFRVDASSWAIITDRDHGARSGVLRLYFPLLFRRPIVKGAVAAFSPLPPAEPHFTLSCISARPSFGLRSQSRR